MSSSINGHDCKRLFVQPLDQPEKVYIHPLSKRSVLSLSLKSLEMCTESLGNESGSCIIDSDFYPPENQVPGGSQKPKTKLRKTHFDFPPPLSSIAGGDGVHIESHREEGRLVIKASHSSSLRIYFKTERANGRLKLSLPRNRSSGEANKKEEISERGNEEETEPEPEHFWSGSRCNGDRGGSEKLTSLPFWVAIS